jgi:uncharacterized cupin superfamily protein
MSEESITELLTQNYATENLEFESFELASDDVVEGSPVVANATLYQSADGTLLVGVARLSGGTVRYEQSANEIDFVKSGHLVITSESGDKIVATAGTVNRLTKGVVYTKQVIEPYEEVYVMFSDEGFEL